MISPIPSFVLNKMLTMTRSYKKTDLTKETVFTDKKLKCSDSINFVVSVDELWEMGTFSLLTNPKNCYKNCGMHERRANLW